MAIVAKPIGANTAGVSLEEFEELESQFYNPNYTKTVTLFGDSFTFYQRVTDDNNAVYAASAWAYLLSNLGNKLNVVNYSGVGGDNSQMLLDRLQTDVLDNKTDWVFGQIGVNDFYGFDFTAQQVFDNVTSIITQIINNGSKVLWLNCYPQNSSRAGFTSAKSLESAIYNKMLSEWGSGVSDLVVVDVYNGFVDKNDSLNGAAISGTIAGDNIHLSNFGSWLTGEIATNAISKVFNKTNNSESFSPVTSGDVGSVEMSNLTGDGGQLGTGATGIAPDDWFIQRLSGTDGTINGFRDSDGYYRVDINKITAIEQSKFRLGTFQLSSEVVSGESIKAQVLLDCDSGDLLMQELYVYLICDGDVVNRGEWGQVNNGFSTSSGILSSSILINIPSCEVPSNVTDVRLYITATMEGAGNASIKVKNVRINKV